jgi:hypothetical protein
MEVLWLDLQKIEILIFSSKNIPNILTMFHVISIVYVDVIMFHIVLLTCCISFIMIRWFHLQKIKLCQNYAKTMPNYAKIMPKLCQNYAKRIPSHFDIIPLVFVDIIK